MKCQEIMAIREKGTAQTAYTELKNQKHLKINAKGKTGEHQNEADNARRIHLRENRNKIRRICAYSFYGLFHTFKDLESVGLDLTWPS